MLSELSLKEIVIKKLFNPLTGLKSVCAIGPFPNRLEKSDVLIMKKVVSAFIPQGYHLIVDFKYPERAEELLEFLVVENIAYQAIRTSPARINLFKLHDVISHVFFVCSQKTLMEMLTQFWPGLTSTEFSFYVVPDVVTAERWVGYISLNEPQWARRLGVLYELHQSEDLYLTVNVDSMREVDNILQQAAQESGVLFSAEQVVVRPLTLL